MSAALLPELAVGDLAALRAFLSGRGTRGTSLTAFQAHFIVYQAHFTFQGVR